MRQLIKVFESEQIDYLFLNNLLHRLLGDISDGLQFPSAFRHLTILLKHIAPTCGKFMSAIWLSYFPRNVKAMEGRKEQNPEDDCDFLPDRDEMSLPNDVSKCIVSE